MLLFWSEEHIARWCEAWALPRGAVLSPELCWRLALAWFDQNRGEPGWRRRTREEVEAVFGGLGLTSPFWRM